MGIEDINWDYPIAFAFGLLFIAAIVWAIARASRINPLDLPRDGGRPMARIEAAIRELFSSKEFDGEDPIVELWPAFNPPDVWATLLDMLQKKRLIEKYDPEHQTYSYVLA